MVDETNHETNPTAPAELHVIISGEGPDATFVEVEDGAGRSLAPEQYGGRWETRPDGLRALVIPRAVPGPARLAALPEAIARARSLAVDMHSRAERASGTSLEVAQAQRMALDGLLALAREERAERDAGKFDGVADVIAGGFDALAESIADLRERKADEGIPGETIEWPAEMEVPCRTCGAVATFKRCPDGALMLGPGPNYQGPAGWVQVGALRFVDGEPGGPTSSAEGWSALYYCPEHGAAVLRALGLEPDDGAPAAE